MKIFLITFRFLKSLTVFITDDKEEIKKLIDTFFEAFHKKDSATLKNLAFNSFIIQFNLNLINNIESRELAEDSRIDVKFKQNLAKVKKKYDVCKEVLKTRGKMTIYFLQ